MAEVKELEKLPEGWKRVKVGDKDYFAIVGSGIDLFKGMKNYLSTDSVQGTKITHIEDEVSYYNRPSRANMQPKKDRLAFAKMRNTIKVLYIDEKLESNYILSTGFSLLETKGIYPKYVYQYLLSDLFNSQKDRFAEGTTQEAISNDDFEHIFISFPTSFPEQRKIAEILETVDNAMEKTDRIIEKYKRIKQGLMQDLLTKGIDENGQIRSEETHRFKDSPLGKIPEEWGVVKLGDVVKLRNKKMFPPNNQKYIGLENIEKEGGYVSGFTPSEKIKGNASVFKKGDILFGKLRPNLRKYWYARFDGWCSTEIYVIMPNSPEIIRDFLYLVIQSEQFLKLAESKIFGTKMPRTSWNILKTHEFPLPPLPEQHRIALILSQIDEIIEKEERYKEKLERIKQGLMEDLLTGKIRVNHLIEENDKTKEKEVPT